ncbi:Acyl-CoA N-acyltransferase [Phytophthora cactorum]|nr:Acyl-CoA N-acyltransferase [Phytophthora cactorum]
MTPPPARARRSDADYVPQHLRHFVFHSQDDFYVSRHFDPLLLSHLMYEGFLPIASEFQDKCFLLPKLHRQRCVLLVKPNAPEHVPKIVRKRAKKFKFVLNRDFDGVVEGCHEKHGIPWLYPPIVESFKTLFQAADDGVELYPGCKVRFFTVELYDAATDTLVAGELGYTVGSVYTSLTGFSRASGAGTVQLHALSKFLYLAGFKMWDLGMSMDYKMGLGAKDLDRDDFLDELYKWRSRQVQMKLDETKNEDDVCVGVSVKALFDNARLPTGTAEEEVDKQKEEKNKTHGKTDMKRHEKEMDDATEEKREAGAKRKLSSDEEQQGEEKKGKSEADAEAVDRSASTD